MRLLLLFVFCAVSASALAKDDAPEPAPNLTERLHDRVGDSVDSVADWLDMLLARKRYTKKKNESSAKVSQLVTHTEGGNLKTSTDFSLNLRLPNLEKRWQVRFTSYDEQEEARNIEQRKFQTVPRKTEYGAALGLFKKLGKVRVLFQPRLVLRDPLEMRYMLRFSSSAEQKPFSIHPRFELFADPKKGTGEYFGFDFVIDLAAKWELSFQSEEEYRERGNFFSTGHGFTLGYTIDDRSGVGLSSSVSSTNRPAFHLDSYKVGIPYGYELWKEKLRASLTPFLSFSKSDHFKGDAGATFSATLIF